MSKIKYFAGLIFIIRCIDGICQTPEVTTQFVNATTVGRYEKFEIFAGLANVNYSNPYDPEQVDLRAVFTSPTGKVWNIFGFYDNYNNRNQWKVRFAANETGEWHYQLSVKTPAGAGQSPTETFNVLESPWHGWIRVSPVNPHYFIFDDGTPFYGVGPYYPWGVDNGPNGLGLLEKSGCNFWGYWNIMYDTGEIIESMNSGIGRYDQPKCGHIDNLIAWSETRNLKMMLAIWPHDLLSHTVWAHQWHQNPYNTVCAVTDFFESAIAWEFQKKQYRYIIARWGYSRALAIWEIVNEINGTDGWQAGKQEAARAWVGKVHQYLTANDPHQRPTTASQSGGIYWPEGYAEVDVPNVHVYETGWPAAYLGNPLRSSAYNYFKLANQFWNDFEKPAIFGEAGYTDSYGHFAAGSDAYTAWFHNALWASWAGGMAVTPVWWDFGSKQIMTPDVMEQMRHFSQIARDYNYSYQNFQPYRIVSDNCDVYAMRSDSSFFGWVREIYGRPVKGHILQFPALADTSFQITWYNTWTAETIGQSFLVGVDTLVTITVPETAGEIPDVAFFIEKTAEGTVPARIRLGSATPKIFIKRNERAEIQCTIHDSEGRFVRSATNPIQFSIDGPGYFVGSGAITAESGRAQILFAADSTSGFAQIIASSPGLIADTLRIEVASRIRIDDFEDYASNTDLEYIWFIRAGTSGTISLVNFSGETGTALKLNYVIGSGNAPDAGIYRFITEDLSMSQNLEFFLQGDASGRTLAILLFDNRGAYWQYNLMLSDATPEFIRIPINDFNAGNPDSAIRLQEINKISFNILKGSGEFGSGTISLDEINFVIETSETAIYHESHATPPAAFQLQQNYPNPFNSRTFINYSVPQPSPVKIILFDLLGQSVKTLVDKYQHAGNYQIQFDATHLATGIYYYQLIAEGFTQSRKMLLLR